MKNLEEKVYDLNKKLGDSEKNKKQMITNKIFKNLHDKILCAFVILRDFANQMKNKDKIIIRMLTCLNFKKEIGFNLLKNY